MSLAMDDASPPTYWAPPPPEAVPDYPRVGSLLGPRSHRESALLSNLLEAAGVIDPLTRQPYTETMITGLAGGIDFMYALFEYKGYPPMLTLVLRHHPADWVETALERIAASAEVGTTGSAAVAAKRLDVHLAQGRPSSVTVAGAALGHVTPVLDMGSPWSINVFGRAGADYLFEDEGPWVRRIDPTRLAAARAADKKQRHRAITILGSRDLDPVWEVRSAIESTVQAFTGPVLGHAFDVNFGLSGLERFAAAVEDFSTKKGWLRVFAADPSAPFAMLTRLHDCIEFELSAPGGMRYQYAPFLGGGAEALGSGVHGDHRDLAAGAIEAAGAWEDSARAWSVLAESALDLGEPFQRYRHLVHDDRSALFEGEQRPALADPVAALAVLAREQPVPERRIREHLAEIGRQVRSIRDGEAVAVRCLEKALWPK